MKAIYRILQVMFLIGGLSSLFFDLFTENILHDSAPAFTIACIAFSEIMGMKAEFKKERE